MGRLTVRPADLQRAWTIFAGLNARWDLAQAETYGASAEPVVRKKVVS